MQIYIEEQAKNYPQTQKILQKFPHANIVYIKNYKNIFDKSMPNNMSLKPSFVVAKLNSSAITKAPNGYGHNNKQAYFLKTSLNCIFDCSYCFLKGAFKNDIPVYFVNYEEIKEEITIFLRNNIITDNHDKITDNTLQLNSEEGIVNNVLQLKINIKGQDKNFSSDSSEQIHKASSFKKEKISVIDNKIICDNLKKDNKNNYELRLKQNINYKDKIWFYSSDYSDILGMDGISGFLENFVPFFEQFENVMMEVRTKSANIKPILDLGFVPQNTEFAFSLNPQELIEKYEFGTSSLDDRIKAINTLLEKGYKVGLRFLPLLPVKNYEKIYTDFVNYIKTQIDYKKISSTFVSGLLYTKEDYKNILKKYPNLDILYMLNEDDGIFIRESRKVRDFFYNLFKGLDKEYFICLDK